MTKLSADMLFNDSPETELKPCPMCRLMVSKKAFAVVTEKDAPAPPQKDVQPSKMTKADDDGDAFCDESSGSACEEVQESGDNNDSGVSTSSDIIAVGAGNSRNGGGGHSIETEGDRRRRLRLRRASFCDPDGLGIAVDPALVGLGSDGQPLGIPVLPRPRLVPIASTPEVEPGDFAVADTLLQGLWL
jgi:hypothetical protein